ncbi:MAG: sterol desaturase family protein [bacterium]|nr:sterol desaturase family protein [bacterium]
MNKLLLSRDARESIEGWRVGIEYAAYPGIVAAAVAVAMVLFGSGITLFLAVPLVIGAAGAIVILLEIAHPYVANWRVDMATLRADILHTIFSTGGVQVVFEAVTAGALVAAASQFDESGSLWPSELPLLLQLALALVVVEFATYWVHRCFHGWDLGWRIHSLHHSSDQLYILASGRNHPLAVLFMSAAQLAPLLLLGAGDETIALAAVFTGVHGMVQHANIEMRPGPLHWVFSSPDLHRWHHAVAIEDANANYGNNLIIWDVVFRTRFLPHDRPVPREAGVAGMRFPENYAAQLAVPFIFKRLYADAN